MHGEDKPRGNAALYYHPDGYVTARDRLMGRHAAGEGFLDGFVRHARVETLYACAESREHYDRFCRQVTALAGSRNMAWIRLDEPDRLAEPGVLHLPGPDLGTQARQRQPFGAASYSLTGVTHTICTHRVMDSIGDLLIQPLQPWDALICTSDAVRSGVEYLLQEFGEYLRERVGASHPDPRLQLPVIPLGADCERLAGGADRERTRRRLRRQHGIGDDDVCVLFFGRLSYHAKAHPTPMFQAVEAAARATGRRIHLLQAGWFASDGIRRAFMQGGRALCPSVQVSYVDGRTREVRDGIWHAGDIFCSLSDNVQETFGLTPVEAMAAGLPVVASDWDGYRGTVVPGETGFLAPTTMPAPGSGEELARRHLQGIDNYDHYLANACQAVAVDADAVAAALIELVRNPDLRRRMGEAGQVRARRLFDWSVIVEAYQALWAELGARRQAAAEGRPAPRLPALRGDPYAVFAHYATRTLADDTPIELAVAKPIEAFRRLSRLQLNRVGQGVRAGDAVAEDILGRLAAGPQPLGALIAGRQDAHPAMLRRTVGWLAKIGIVKVGA